MDMPSYVNPKGVLTEEALDKIIMGHPSIVSRGRLFSHFAITNAVLKEMTVIEQKLRDYIATWLESQGDSFTPMSNALREGKPLVRDHAPSTKIAETEAHLRAKLEKALQENEALKVELAQIRVLALPSLPSGIYGPADEPSEYGAAPVEASPSPKESTETSPQKPWGVRRKSGEIEYFESREKARQVAQGDPVVDFRKTLGSPVRGEGDTLKKASQSSSKKSGESGATRAENGDAVVAKFNAQGHLQFPTPMLKALGWGRGAKVCLVDLVEDGIIVRLCPLGFEHDGRLQESSGVLRIRRAAFARYFSEVKDEIKLTLDLREGGIWVDVD